MTRGQFGREPADEADDIRRDGSRRPAERASSRRPAKGDGHLFQTFNKEREKDFVSEGVFFNGTFQKMGLITHICS